MRVSGVARGCLGACGCAALEIGSKHPLSCDVSELLQQSLAGSLSPATCWFHLQQTSACHHSHALSPAACCILLPSKSESQSTNTLAFTSMVLACGPMNWMPSSPQRLAKVAFSERKPYPAAEGVNESSQRGSQPTKREVIGALSSEGYIPMLLRPNAPQK